MFHIFEQRTLIAGVRNRPPGIYFKIHSKMNADNLVVIKGGSYAEIKKVLQQWIRLYADDLPDGLTFQLYRNGSGNHIISADEQLDNQRFFFLVNYLKYPEGVNYDIDVEGFTVGKEKNKLFGKIILVHVSPTEEKYDCVHVTTAENENYRVDFDGKISSIKESKKFQLPSNLQLENPDLITVSKKAHLKEKQKAEDESLHKRFRLFTLAASGLVLISFFVAIYDLEAFAKLSLFFGIGLGTWFFGDYKMLQSGRHYYNCLIISLLFIGYVALSKHFLNLTPDMISLGALNPIMVLILQKPSRMIYKALLKREPVVDGPPPTFWDAVYMLVMISGFIVLPLILASVLKQA
jgi:hypothetical protein